ncbi:MAG: hypothetical protein ACOVP4_02915 [Bacteriovoracaceae bacterium]
MKKLIFLMILSMTSMAAASPFQRWPCSKEIGQLTKEWKASETWEKFPLGGLSDHFFGAPTDKIGEWVLLRKKVDGVGVAKADQRGRVEVSIDAKSCKKTVKPYNNQPVSSDFYADDKLARFVDKNKKGIIYVWSPRMGLSEKGVEQIKLAAKKKKLPLLVLLDKEVSKDEVAQLKKKYGDPSIVQADSFELKMRNASQHFPALLVFKDKKISTKVKYGYEKASQYELDLERMLK